MRGGVRDLWGWHDCRRWWRVGLRDCPFLVYEEPPADLDDDDDNLHFEVAKKKAGVNTDETKVAQEAVKIPVAPGIPLVVFPYPTREDWEPKAIPVEAYIDLSYIGGPTDYEDIATPPELTKATVPIFPPTIGVDPIPQPAGASLPGELYAAAEESIANDSWNIPAVYSPDPYYPGGDPVDKALGEGLGTFGSKGVAGDLADFLQGPSHCFGCDLVLAAGVLAAIALAAIVAAQLGSFQPPAALGGVRGLARPGTGGFGGKVFESVIEFGPEDDILPILDEDPDYVGDDPFFDLEPLPVATKKGKKTILPVEYEPEPDPGPVYVPYFGVKNDDGSFGRTGL